MSKELREKFVSKIREVFKHNQYPGDDLLFLSDFGGPSLALQAFAGKQWDNVPLASIVSYRDYFTFLIPQGFRYFLPTFLIAALHYPNEVDTLIDTMIFNFAHMDDTKKIKLLSTDEKRVILEFLENYWSLYSDLYDDWYFEESPYEELRIQAIEYWQEQIDANPQDN